MKAEQKYSFERIADLLIAIKDSAYPFTVEIYNKEIQDVQMRGGHWGDADFTTSDIDKAVGYLFDKMEMFGWRLWRYETMFGIGSSGDRITIYLMK
jgi:hypothetical protein